MTKVLTIVTIIAISLLLLKFAAISSNGDLQEETLKKDCSIFVYIQEPEIIAEGRNGDIIERQVAGIDDSKVIRDSIDHLDNGSILFIGSFKITSSIDNLKSGICLRGIEGKTKFDCTKIGSIGFTNGDGGYSRQIIDLAKDAKAGDNIIYVMDAKNLNKGDYIKVVDDFNITGFKNGQIYKIMGININSIRLDKSVKEDYKLERNANIRKLKFCENITVEGIEFIGPGMETDQHFMQMYLQRNFTFKNNIVRTFGEEALSLTDSMDSVIRNNIFENIFKPGFGYSVVIANACENISVEKNIFRGKGRHYVVCTAGHGTAIDGGFARNIDILDNNFENSTQEAFNTHEPFIGPLSIANNTFVFCDKGIEITNGNSDIYENIFKNCGIGIHLFADQGRTYNIYTNLFENCDHNLLIDINSQNINGSECGEKFYLSSDELRCI